ncbi:hypothetical protein PSEUDO8AS_40540 [Pseudomonas sp. 8AS]|nr:hypothetical protein PSEUDO8AS_40540 [Pseudomonas sp. 8AS]
MSMLATVMEATLPKLKGFLPVLVKHLIWLELGSKARCAKRAFQALARSAPAGARQSAPDRGACGEGGQPLCG